jgi:hypothetical protein
VNDAHRSHRRDHRHDSGSRGPAIVGGLLLIALGVGLIAVNSFGMQLPFDLGSIGWSIFILAPGVLLLLVGLVTGGDGGQGMAVGGGVVTTIGLILAYQSATDHWTSWAYAWALIAPTSVGLSMMLWGALHGRGDVVRDGLSAFAIGIVLFIVGFAFFEGVLHLGGDKGLSSLGMQVLPIALIAAGALVIIGGIWPRRHRPAPSNTDWGPPPGYQPPQQPDYPPPAFQPPPVAVREPDSDEETTTHSSVS